MDRKSTREYMVSKTSHQSLTKHTVLYMAGQELWSSKFDRKSYTLALTSAQSSLLSVTIQALNMYLALILEPWPYLVARVLHCLAQCQT